MIEKEYRETIVKESHVDCVKAMYPYGSKTFSMQRGEVLELKDKSNGEWWLVENSSGKEGFAPANYLKDIGVQKFAKQQERYFKLPEKIKVKKPKSSGNLNNPLVATKLVSALTNILKPIAKRSSLRRKTTSIQPRQLKFMNTEGLKKRQIEVNTLYAELLEASLEKRKQLENAKLFYRWHRRHEEFVKWTKDKLVHLSVDEKNSLIDSPDAAKRRYQAFSTDFLANQAEFGELEKVASEISDKNLTIYINGQIYTSSNVSQLQASLKSDYQKLLDLKRYWDNAIKAIQCIEKFNMVHADVNDLLLEKLGALNRDDLNESGDDVKSVRALQSKQDKLERDMGPIDTNVGDLRKTAEEVCKYFPHEKPNVSRKLESIEALLDRLKKEVGERKARLNEKHGLQRFENEVQDLNVLCARLSTSLAELDAPRDLKQCDEFQKRFNETEQEFNSQLTFKLSNLKQMSHGKLTKLGVTASIDKINDSIQNAKLKKNQLGDQINYKKKY